MSKKAQLAEVCNAAGLFGLAPMLRNRRQFSILAYHRILDIPANFKFDKELVSASKRDFEWQVEYVAKHFTPVTLSELMQCISNDLDLPKGAVLITFDDGFSDNYDTAYQVLKRVGVPATFFVCTDYIGKDQPFWFDWVVYLLNNIAPGDYPIGDGAFMLSLGDGVQSERDALARRFFQYLKSVPDTTRQGAVAQLSSQCAVAVPAGGFADSRPMNWEQLREMASNGMEIGSHTKSHPVLSQLTPDELVEEVTQSKALIEAETGKTVNSLSYPVGGAAAYNDEVAAVVRDSGYLAACSYVSGANRVRGADHFALQRLHVERYVSQAMFKALLHTPRIFA